MIRYRLACESGHSFEGWFRGSTDFDTQRAENAVICPACGSHEIAKQLMTPSVSTARAKALRAQEFGPAGSQETENAAGHSAPAAAKADAGQDSAEASQQIAFTDPRVDEMVDTMRKIRQQVVDTSENVGKRFAEEARAMHFGETEKRGIYGEASAKDTSSLIEDGIDVYPLPVLPEDRN